MTFKITALYKFFDNSNPEEFKEKLKVLCKEFGVTGMLIVAGEGLNGTIAAEAENMDAFLPRLFALEPQLSGLEIKFSFSDEQPFYRMRIAVKREIVTLGVDGYNVHLSDRVEDIEPHDWNDLISREDVVLVDTRNDYEYSLGTFEGAIDPQTKNFREFPAFMERLEKREDPTDDGSEKKSLAMFCTGGIRCDKVAAYVADTSKYNKIYRLKGGILKYLEEIPEEHSKWKGDCFVFDQRVTVKHGLVAGECELCRGCRYPLTPDDRAREDFKEGIHCRYCVDKLTPEQMKSAAERHLQIQLLSKRNQKHLGFEYQPHQKRKFAGKSETSIADGVEPSSDSR